MARGSSRCFFGDDCSILFFLLVFLLLFCNGWGFDGFDVGCGC